MGFEVRIDPTSLTVELSGWDRIATLTRRLVVDRTSIEHAAAERRDSLEHLIDHRALGIGTHDGDRRPNRRRIGTMLGRAVVGKQFWVVPAGEPSAMLLVLDLGPDTDIARLVIAVDDAEAIAAELAPPDQPN